MSNQAIADQLFISLAAVKWHARNIYGKLEVNNRTQAVARARELEAFTVVVTAVSRPILSASEPPDVIAPH